MNELPLWAKPDTKEETLNKVLKRVKRQWDKPLSLWKKFISDDEREVLFK